MNKKNIFSALKNLEEILAYTTKLGFRTNLNFILGTPGETENSLRNKASYIIKHCSSPGIVPLLGFLTPHRGTQLYQNAGDLGIKIVDDNYEHYNHLQPVCVPVSLGENALVLLKRTYNKISRATGSLRYNPLLDEQNATNRSSGYNNDSR